MFRQITHQFVRTIVTKPTDLPRGCRNVGTNLPFNIFNTNLLTLKFILFFGSAFYLPFFALHFQLKKQGFLTEYPNKAKIPEVYKFIPEDEKKATEIYA